jgi:hypothetical protein
MSSSHAFCLLFFIPFAPLCFLLLTWNPPCCDRIRPPQSQVVRKLISPFPHSTPYTLHSKIPTPWGFPELNIHFTKTTSRTWVTRSSTPMAPYRCLLFYISNIVESVVRTVNILYICLYLEAGSRQRWLEVNRGGWRLLAVAGGYETLPSVVKITKTHWKWRKSSGQSEYTVYIQYSRRCLPCLPLLHWKHI